jgi:hypothetical protein
VIGVNTAMVRPAQGLCFGSRSIPHSSWPPVPRTASCVAASFWRRDGARSRLVARGGPRARACACSSWRPGAARAGVPRVT